MRDRPPTPIGMCAKAREIDISGHEFQLRSCLFAAAQLKEGPIEEFNQRFGRSGADDSRAVAHILLAPADQAKRGM